MNDVCRLRRDHVVECLRQDKTVLSEHSTTNILLVTFRTLRNWIMTQKERNKKLIDKVKNEVGVTQWRTLPRPYVFLKYHVDTKKLW